MIKLGQLDLIEFPELRGGGGGGGRFCTPFLDLPLGRDVEGGEGRERRKIRRKRDEGKEGRERRGGTGGKSGIGRGGGGACMRTEEGK